MVNLHRWRNWSRRAPEAFTLGWLQRLSVRDREGLKGSSSSALIGRNFGQFASTDAIPGLAMERLNGRASSNGESQVTIPAPLKTVGQVPFTARACAYYPRRWTKMADRKRATMLHFSLSACGAFGTLPDELLLDSKVPEPSSADHIRITPRWLSAFTKP